jgi:ATP-binding cassette subfamily B protein
VSLLLRFRDVDSGKIVIDGYDIKNIKQSSLRGAIAYVPQEALLFHRTLEENIKYSNEHATKDEIIKASTRAHALEFINSFPQKFNTLVGERGIKLSGGQKQRVMIARAMLKKSPILVLDEATSSLDSHAEKMIQEALEELMKNRTTIVIAHRLSTLKQMDRIIVFDDGKIVEDGTHKELLGKNGKYWELWQHQAGGFE